jgi:hypothetical protein
MAGSTCVVPATRFTELVTSEVGGELLVYDPASHHIHRLNRASAAVWRLCNGQRTLTDVVSETGMADDTVRVALAELADARLLRDELAPGLRGSAQSRRALLKKAAIAGTVPAIVSITAPIAAAAATCLPSNGVCTGSAQCCSGVCFAGRCA